MGLGVVSVATLVLTGTEAWQSLPTLVRGARGAPRDVAAWYRPPQQQQQRSRRPRPPFGAPPPRRGGGDALSNGGGGGAGSAVGRGSVALAAVAPGKIKGQRSDNADEKEGEMAEDAYGKGVPMNPFFDQAWWDVMHDDTRDWDSMTPEQWEEIYPPWADDFAFNLEPGQRYRYVPDEQAPFVRTFVAVCRDRDDDDAFIARNELMIDHVAWARASVHRYEVANASHAPRAYVYKDVALLSADELYTTGNLVVVMAHSRADFEALMASEPYARAGIFESVETYRWGVNQDPHMLRTTWRDDGPAMLPYLHLSMDRASGGAGGGGDDDPRAVRRKTRAMHLSFLKKTMRTMYAGPLHPLERGPFSDPATADVHDALAAAAAANAEEDAAAAVRDEATAAAAAAATVDDEPLVWSDEPAAEEELNREDYVFGMTSQGAPGYLRKSNAAVAPPLLSIDVERESAPPVGSLVIAFHEDELDAVKWAGKDPYARAGLFGAPATAVAAAPDADADAAAGSSSILRFTDLDVNGRHCYDRGSIADQPDPVMARMVELGLVDLPEREVDMIILSDDKQNKEQNPEWPLERVTVHTRDPRLVSNIAPSLQGRYEREMIEDTDSLYREGVIAED